MELKDSYIQKKKKNLDELMLLLVEAGEEKENLFKILSCVKSILYRSRLAPVRSDSTD